MEVRKAHRGDLLGVGRVVHAACWETYTGLLKPAVISEVLDTVYSPSNLKRRLLQGGLIVCTDERQVVVGFAMVSPHEDYVELEAIFTDPDFRRRGIGSRLMEEVDRIAGGRPICIDVLLGSLEGEHFQEAFGFVPGEIIETEIGGEPIVERRWWRADGLAPDSG